MSRNNLVVNRAERSFTMSRIFNAPRELVWKALTDPGLLAQWWGRRDHFAVVDQAEVRPGGAWRFVETDAQGNQDPFRGVFKIVEPPERLSYTFEYEPLAGHISTDLIVLEELPDGRTKIIATTTFDSVEDLDGMLQTGMEGGAVESWDKLEELLAAVLKEG